MKNAGLIPWMRSVETSALAYTPPLDVYTGAKRAYGLRLLRSAYTGPLIRLTRASDSATLDIYPQSNGLIDEAEVLEFKGANSFISNFYDQSGNGFDIPSYVAFGRYPYINDAASSVFETINGKHSLKGGYFYDTSPFMYASSANTFIAVVQGPNTNPTSAIITGESSSSSNFPVYTTAIKYGASSSQKLAQFLRTNANSIVVSSTVNDMGNVYNNSPHIIYNRDSGSNFRVIIDNVSDINDNYTRSGTLTLNRFSILGLQQAIGANLHDNLKLSEIIFYDSDKDSDASGLMSNLNSYFGTY